MHGLVLQVAPAARPQSPADGQADVDETMVFRWTSGAAYVHAVWFFPVTPGERTLGIDLTGDATQLPAISSLGLALPPGAAYSWYVERFVAAAGVDDAAASGRTPTAAAFTRSETLAFTTRAAMTLRREHP